MRIALDYDGTFTRDPVFWRTVVAIAVDQMGHEVVCITERHEDQPIAEPLGCSVHYTGGESKVRYSGRKGLNIDVWIDDRPHRLMLAD